MNPNSHNDKNVKIENYLEASFDIRGRLWLDTKSLCGADFENLDFLARISRRKFENLPKIPKMEKN